MTYVSVTEQQLVCWTKTPERSSGSCCRIDSPVDPYKLVLTQALTNKHNIDSVWSLCVRGVRRGQLLHRPVGRSCLATLRTAQSLTLAAPTMHRKCEASDSQSDEGECRVFYKLVQGSRRSHAGCASVVSTVMIWVMMMLEMA
jgi:hypothetical protein